MSKDDSYHERAGFRTFSAHKSSAEKDFGRSIVSNASICVRSVVMVRYAYSGRSQDDYGFA